MIKHYIEYVTYGLVSSEITILEVPERDINEIQLPHNCFGYRFFDKIITYIYGKTLESEKCHVSAWTYQGKKMSLRYVEEHYSNDGTHGILIKKMKDCGCYALLKTTFGQFVFLDESNNIIQTNY